MVAEGVPNPAPLVAETLDISKNGARIRYIGDRFSRRNRITIYIISLNLKRDARVVWSKRIDGMEAFAGLNFTEPIPMPVSGISVRGLTETSN